MSDEMPPVAPPPWRVLRSGGRTGMVSRLTPEMEGLATRVLEAALSGDVGRIGLTPFPPEQLRRGAAELAAAEVLRNRGPLDGMATSMVEQMERRALDRLREMGQPRPPTSYASVEDVARVLPPGMGVDIDAMFRIAEIPLARPGSTDPVVTVPGLAGVQPPGTRRSVEVLLGPLLPAPSRDEAVFAEIRRMLPYEVAITAETDPLDDVVRVTLERASGRAMRWQQLARVRRALLGSAYVPMGRRVVVRDAASLRGQRDRAVEPVREKREAVTRAALEARLFGDRGRPRVAWMLARPGSP